MKIVTGIDLVYLPRFKKALKNGGQEFLRRIFLESELHLRGETAHLAGIFAAKEAIMKALDLPKDSWHDIRITNNKSGAPEAQIENLKPALSKIEGLKIESCSLSISHDGSYVIAQCVGILKR